MGRASGFAFVVIGMAAVFASSSHAYGQQAATTQPEVVPAPPGEPQGSLVYVPRPQYDPIRAMEEAAEQAQMAARAAIRQQMAIAAYAPLYSPSIVFPYRYPTAVVPPVYYGPPRAVRRAQRNLERAGAPYAVYVPATPWAARLSIAAPLPPAQQSPAQDGKRSERNGQSYRSSYDWQPSKTQPAAAPTIEPGAPSAWPTQKPGTSQPRAIPPLSEPPVLTVPPEATPRQPDTSPEPIPPPSPAQGPQEF